MARYQRHKKAGSVTFNGHIEATGFDGPVQIDVYERKERQFNMYGTTNITALRELSIKRSIRHILDTDLLFWFMSNQKGYEPYWGTQVYFANTFQVSRGKVSEAFARLAKLNLIEKVTNDYGQSGYRLNPSLYFYGTSADCGKAIYDWCDRNSVMPLPGCFQEKKIADMLKRRGTAAANVHTFFNAPEAA